MYNRKKYMTVCDIITAAESLGDFFIFVGKKDSIYQKDGKKLFKKSLKSFGDRC